MLLQVVLNDARNAIISSEAGRRQINIRELEDIRQEILTLEDSVPQDLDRIQFYRDRYEELISTQSVIEMNNRQDSFKIDGERPSAFFLNLEKHRVSDNYISRLRDGNELITDQKKIEKCIHGYYEELYENKDDLRTNI